MRSKNTLLVWRHGTVDSSAPSILPPRVWVPSTPSTLSSIIKLCKVKSEKTKINKKRPGLAHFYKKEFFTRGPPLLPNVMAASVWMYSETFLPLRCNSDLFLATLETTPVVIVFVRDNGDPIATTNSPIISWKRFFNCCNNPEKTNSLVTVRLTSCLTGLDLPNVANLYLIQHKQSSWIQTSQTGGLLCSDTSPYKVPKWVFSE